MQIKRFVPFIILLLVLLTVGIALAKEQTGRPSVSQEATDQTSQKSHDASMSTQSPLPSSYSIPGGNFVSQTFNNCGPASLSMTLSFFGKHVSQGDLASTMRPFNNPYGGVDDKSIFAHEFFDEAKRQGFDAISRPNGSIEVIHKLVSQNIPVVVRTWLNDHEDIGHFRVITGFDADTKILTYQDSYYGPNQTQTESDFLALWKPFNYGYIIVYPSEKKSVVENIVGGDMNEHAAWERARENANSELTMHPDDSFSAFNLSVSQYYLGNYEQSIHAYEDALKGLPTRMLWYQPEPIYAYQKTGAYDRAIELADSILHNGNLAYSEMYQLKGEIYQAQGKNELAREMFENALYYNTSFTPAKKSLSLL